MDCPGFCPTSGTKTSQRAGRYVVSKKPVVSTGSKCNTPLVAAAADSGYCIGGDPALAPRELIPALSLHSHGHGRMENTGWLSFHRQDRWKYKVWNRLTLTLHLSTCHTLTVGLHKLCFLPIIGFAFVFK